MRAPNARGWDMPVLASRTQVHTRFSLAGSRSRRSHTVECVGRLFREENERGETRCVAGLKNTDLESGVSLYAAAEDAVTVCCESGRVP